MMVGRRSFPIGFRSLFRGDFLFNFGRITVSLLHGFLISTSTHLLFLLIHDASDMKTRRIPPKKDGITSLERGATQIPLSHVSWKKKRQIPLSHPHQSWDPKNARTVHSTISGIVLFGINEFQIHQVYTETCRLLNGKTLSRIFWI